MTLFGDKPVVVTMLGTYSSGKTCYMSAMYAKMAHGRGLNGYCLKAEKHVDSRKLLAMWERIVKGKDLQQGRFPEATADPNEYTFALSYAADKPIIKFDWLDVGGRSMSNVDEDPSRQKLLERLKKTDCLMLCISGEHFKEPITDINREEILLNIDSQFINYLIGELQYTGNNTPPSIAIVVTQYDHCKDREPTTVLDDIKQMFPILFEAKGWLVMVCSVTLGLELANNIAASISPINVHIPVVFSLLSKMIRVQWEKVVRQKLYYKQSPSTIKEALKNIDSSKFQTPNDNEIKLAKVLKEEIVRLSTILLMHHTNTLRFSIYLDGKQVSWKEILE